jgi:hypothetical protein
VPLCCSYASPKIAEKNPWSEADVKAFMDASHDAPDDDVSVTRTEFALAALPSIFEKMHEGQWYQSLPKAGCADSHIKCAPGVVVDFQFKNTSDGMHELEARKEAPAPLIFDGYFQGVNDIFFRGAGRLNLASANGRHFCWSWLAANKYLAAGQYYHYYYWGYH